MLLKLSLQLPSKLSQNCPEEEKTEKKAQLTELWASISNENFYFIQQMIKQISPA